MNYTPPKYNEEAFHCPYCNTYAHMSWHPVKYLEAGSYYSADLKYSKCVKCRHYALWDTETYEMLKPANVTAPMAHIDMPDEIKMDFNEAREISNKSPRSAAALLRLCIQKLCKHLGEKGKKIDDDIASLVSKGLAPEIIEAFDTIRVLGNESVHPGDLTPEEIREDMDSLFMLTNFIVEEMISAPKKRKALFDKLPQSKKDGIAARNKRAQSKTA